MANNIPWITYEIKMWFKTKGWIVDENSQWCTKSVMGIPSAVRFKPRIEFFSDRFTLLYTLDKMQQDLLSLRRQCNVSSEKFISFSEEGTSSAN